MTTKQPSESRAMLVPFGTALASVGSATVAAQGMVPGGAALIASINGIGTDGQSVSLEVSGGADGERYLVTVDAAPTAGGTLEQELNISVIDFGWAIPPLSTPYLTATAFVDRLGFDLAVQLTGGNVGGRIDKAMLGDALIDATAQADSYLGALYVTPLAVTPVPARLVTIVYDLAVARLWRGQQPDDVRLNAAQAIASLKNFANGTERFPTAELLAPAVSSPTPVLYSGEDRMFTRSSLCGF